MKNLLAFRFRRIIRKKFRFFGIAAIFFLGSIAIFLNLKMEKFEKNENEAKNEKFSNSLKRKLLEIQDDAENFPCPNESLKEDEGKLFPKDFFSDDQLANGAVFLHFFGMIFC